MDVASSRTGGGLAQRRGHFKLGHLVSKICRDGRVGRKACVVADSHGQLNRERASYESRITRDEKQNSQLSDFA